MSSSSFVAVPVDASRYSLPVLAGVQPVPEEAAVQSFQNHLKGLLTAFLAIQQDCHERENNLSTPKESDLDRELPCEEHQKITFETTLSELLSRVEVTVLPPLQMHRAKACDSFTSELSSVQLTEQEPRGLAGDVEPPEPNDFGAGELPDGPEHEDEDDQHDRNKSSSSRLHFGLFRRLQNPDTGVITPEALTALVQAHCPGHALENIGEALTFARVQPAPLDRSATSTFLCSTFATVPNEGAANSCAVDFDTFLLLKSGTLVKQASHGVKRDLERLQQALHNEHQHLLFEDDGHDEWDNRLVRQQKEPTGLVVTLMETLPSFVVVLQACILGISSDVEPESTVWEVLEFSFTAIYLVEAVVKSYVLTIKGYFCGPDRLWNWLDFACLVMSIMDAVVMLALQSEQLDLNTLVLLRLLRLFRLARLLKTVKLPMFRELQLLIWGIISGARVLAWSLIVLVMILYVLALVLTKLLHSEEEFSTVVSAMSLLFRCFTDGCVDDQGRPKMEYLRKEYGPLIFWGYLCVYILVSVGVFNLVMALFIDNVVNTQADRKQKELSDTSEATEVELKEALIKLLIQSKASGIPDDVEEEVKSFDNIFPDRAIRIRAQFQCLCDAGPHIGADQFSIWLEDKHFIQVLSRAEIDVHNRAVLFEVVDADLGGSLTLIEMFDGLMKLRGPVTKADIIAIRLKVRHLVKSSHSDSAQADNA